MEGGIMTDIRMSQMASGIPYGDNAERPLNPEIGTIYSNGEAARLELYTNNGWQNIVQEVPGVAGISGTYNESSGSATIVVSGTNFVSGALVYAVGTNAIEVQASPIVFDSIIQLTATLTGLSPQYEPYDIKVVNPSNLFSILPDVLYINNVPTWTTPAGSIGSFSENSSISTSVIATDQENATLTYSLTSGSLPAGVTLSSDGTISGTTPSISGDTTYNFTISVTDGSNSISRSFSLLVLESAPVWSTLQTLESFSKNVSYSATLVANDDSGAVPTYSIISGSLPTGLSLNSSTGVLNGTPSTSLTKTFTVRATDANNKYSDRLFTIPNSVPTFSQSSPPGGLVSLAYSYTMLANDDGEITYALLSGSLPTGLSLNSSTGVLSGTPTTPGTYTFVIRATDDNGSTVDTSTLNATISETSNISATGGSTYTSNGYRYHKFTGSGTFSVSSNPYSVGAEVLVVAGGGAGGNDVGGAGGAGGLIYNSSYPIPSGSYTVTVGAGGTSTEGGTTLEAAMGKDSYFASMQAFGGGAGTNWNQSFAAQVGGSGGGGAGYNSASRYGAASNQTSNNGGTGYGNSGGNGFNPAGSPTSPYGGGGGGGAGAVGGSGTQSTNGNGGIGLNTWSTWATATGSGDNGYFAGGGGGANDYGLTPSGTGGLGGGGTGGAASNQVGSNGLANTGGGGGGANGYPGGAGGSGIVIVRYLV